MEHGLHFFLCVVPHLEPRAIGCSPDHGGKHSARLWSEQAQDRLTKSYCPAQFVANTQGWLCHFCHDHIGLPEPGQVPLMDELVAPSSLFPTRLQLSISHVLSEHLPIAPQPGYDPRIQSLVFPPAADAPAEVHRAWNQLPGCRHRRARATAAADQ